MHVFILIRLENNNLQVGSAHFNKATVNYKDGGTSSNERFCDTLMSVAFTTALQSHSWYQTCFADEDSQEIKCLLPKATKPTHGGASPVTVCLCSNSSSPQGAELSTRETWM